MATAGRLLNDFEAQQPSSLAVQDSIHPLLPKRSDIPVTWRSFQAQDEELAKDPIRSGVPEPGLEPMYGDELLMLAPAVSIGRTMIDDIGALTPRLLANSALRGGAARTAGEALMSTPVGRTAMRRFAETPIGRETAARIYSGIPVVEQQGMLGASRPATSSTVADVLGRVPEPQPVVRMLQPPQYNEMVRYGVDPAIAKELWSGWDRVVNNNMYRNTENLGIYNTTTPEYREPSNEWVARAELGLRERFDRDGKNPIIGLSLDRALAGYHPTHRKIEYTRSGVFRPVNEFNKTYRHERGHDIAYSEATEDGNGLTTQDYINAILPNEMPDEFIRIPEISKLAPGEALVEYWKDHGLIDDAMYKHIQDQRIAQRWNAERIRDEIPSTLAEADTIPYAIGKNLIELSAPLRVEDVLNNIRVGKDRLWSGEVSPHSSGASGMRNSIEQLEAKRAATLDKIRDSQLFPQETAQGFLDRQGRIARYDAAKAAAIEPWRFESRELVQKAKEMFESGDENWTKYAPEHIRRYYYEYDEDDMNEKSRMVGRLLSDYLELMNRGH